MTWKKLFFLLHVFLLSTLLSSDCFAEIEDCGRADPSEKKWAITLFNGIYTSRKVGETTFNIPGNFESNYIHGLSISRQLLKTEKHFSFEWEGMFAIHHGKHKTGYQDYEEYVMAVFVRYHTFPWNHIINTSVAIGEGLSYTSETPIRESQRNDNDSQHLLNYLGIEIALTLPKYPDFGLVYRIHHRSGVFGLFGGVKGASDFYMLGLRYKF